MNVAIEKRDDLSALIRVTVAEADYQEAVDKMLRDYRRKANVPGFRPGMVPMGIINKMYRKGAVAEESYRTASKAAFDYIEAENITYVGDVLPSDEQAEFDFENGKEHEFLFEIGIAPEVNIPLSTKDKLTHYNIEPDKEMADNYRTSFLRRYGKLEEVDAVAADEALTVTLDNGTINLPDSYVGLISMNEEQRKPFIGKKVGDVMQVNVNELYTNPSQRAAILKVKEDELDSVEPNFTLTIEKIRKFVEPELNEEFFGLAFPDGSIKDEAAFDDFIKSQITRDLNRESDYLFNYQIRKMLTDKAALAMPENFLKKWLFTVNEGKFTMEQIEADFSQFLEMMRWNLIQSHYAKTLEIKIEPEEALQEAKALTMMQFAQYGMNQIPDETLTGYAQQMLTNQEEARKIYDKLLEHKVIEGVKPLISITEKTVSPEEFGKIAEKAGQE